MKKPVVSLKMGLLTTIVICWLLPILIVMVLSGVLFGRSYRQNVLDEIDLSAHNALLQVQVQLEDAIDDSKDVSYDGVIRNAYRSYLNTHDRAALYRSTIDYLSLSFFREEQYKAVSIHYWDKDIDVNSYYLSSGISGYELLNQCRENVPEILKAMQNADTKILFLTPGGQLCMVRNLLDSSFVPYASVVMMLDPEYFFRPLTAINRIDEMQLYVDDAVLVIDGDTVTVSASAGEEWERTYEIEADGHRLFAEAKIEKYNVWDENPWLLWAVLSVALLVLPLLLVMISLFYRHITRPMEVLAEANTKVESGQRGYAIEQCAPNAEFDKLYRHFNSMSEELQGQFERSYLEQQATQRAQIKALQSQINPHFLNNTLEIINWEARLAQNERISTMIEALSTMLGAALDRDGRNQIALQEELGYIEAYLYIINERLGGKLNVRQDIAPGMEATLIPRLILQPIVENAVEHDIVVRRGGNLVLRAFEKDELIVLEVEHDGTMTESDRANIEKLLSEEDTGKGQLGLRNVHKRLKLLYGDKGTLTIDGDCPGLILARISFPKN
ncbi:MAG: histidine kinase [Oscillospiraceae bacterium]|nr:histidine kinase [Oscillospiraceae bacterium]